jgi:tetratricopeptide (TPR) repeat protein
MEPVKSDLIENRQIRVFISSTFRDMHAERDHLIKRVFPPLRRYCEERDVSFFELDLRWGIPEKESKQGKTVDICLQEIKKTTPFFIGLLGKRYGWAPAEKDMQSIESGTTVLEEYPWINAELDKGTSITEIEIQQGVLRAEEKVNAYFYFRSPKMETPPEFSEQPGSREEQKLRALKTVLRDQKEYPVQDYDSVEHLGALVEQDFKALVDRLFPQEDMPSEFDKERLEQRAYFKSLNAVYVPIAEYDEKFDRFIESAEREFLVWGVPGVGKSALLAHWIKRRGERENEKIIYHFIGNSRSEGDYRKITVRLIDEIRRQYNLPAAPSSKLPEKDANQQKKELEDLLFSLGDKGRLVIILDGMDKLSDAAEAKQLKWLPLFPDAVKFIFSTQSKDETMEYFSRMGYRGIEMKALDMESRKTLIKEYLDSFGKKLVDPQIERIAADKENEPPFVLRTVLDELRIFGVHEKLDDEIDRYLKAESIPELFTLVLDRWEKTYNYSNENFVKEVLSLLYAARQGLSEAEIRVFTDTPHLYWSQLSYGIASHLAVRSGMISLSNSFIRDAVKNRYLGDDAALRAYRLKLVKSMKGPNSMASPYRKYAEIAYQLFELADWDDLYRFLLDFEILQYFGLDELFKYWRALYGIDREKYLLEEYLKIDTQGRTAAEAGRLFQTLCHLAIALKESSLALRFVDEAIRLVPDDATAYYYRGLTYFNNDYDRAIADYSRAIQLNPNFFEAYNDRGNVYMNGKKDYDHAIVDYSSAIRLNPNLAISYNNRGIAYRIKGDYDRAIADYTEAIRLNPNNAMAKANMTAAKVNKGTFEKGAFKTIYTIVGIGSVITFMAGFSYFADRVDTDLLHSLAIIANIAGIAWCSKTILVGVLKRVLRPKRLIAALVALRLLTVLLDIGLSVYFVKSRKTENPVSVVLQNPFRTAQNFFGGGKGGAEK